MGETTKRAQRVQRKQLGAYYTPDDVTGFMARGVIIPWLLDRVGVTAVLWRSLCADPDRYIHEAVRATDALPTETTCERQARRQRYRKLSLQLRRGKVQTVNELVTLNLDLERFAHDAIATSEPDWVRRFLTALAEITVLDPTCGDGAFLCAALKVLGELWLACLRRLGKKADRSAIRRAIVENNLYGVDLRAEAVQLCKRNLSLQEMTTSNLRVGNALAGFDWPAEFPLVRQRGGFDVVLGNPPYIPAERARRAYTVEDYVTAACPDVYAWVLERTAALVRPGGRTGMIVPLSLGFSADFAACRELLFATYGANWFASFARIPSALFAGDVRVRNIIHLGHKSAALGRQHATRLHRWFDAARPHLFQTLEYAPFRPERWRGRVPKLNTAALVKALEARAHLGRLGDCLTGRTAHVLYFKKTAYNWLSFSRRPPPCFDAGGAAIAQTQFDTLYFASAGLRDLALLLLNGKWAFAYWSAVGDDFHVTRWTLADLPIDLVRLPSETIAQLWPLARQLEAAMRRAVVFKHNAGKRVGSYNLALCRAVTDRSDQIFAAALGLEDVWRDVELLYRQVVKTDFASR